MLEAIHVTADGAKYLPWAQSKLRALRALLNSMGLNFGHKFYSTPDGHGLVEIRTRRGQSRIGEIVRQNTGRTASIPFSPEDAVDDWYDYIRISVCVDRPGFILTRKFDHPAPHYAHYVDGEVHFIPTTVLGEVDPEGHPTSRVKNYIIPDELYDGALLPAEFYDLKFPNNSSRYTGIMRRVVGCYHAGGSNAPFSYTWSRTHGIAKYVHPSGEEEFWLVEISASGVFAAPIAGGDKCCGNWGVRQYMPTIEQLVADISLFPHLETVSLAWAYTGRPNSGVFLLLTAEQMADAYSGTTWYNGCGWAFNYSGTQVANVGYKFIFDTDFGGNPDYYETRLFTIDFEYREDGANRLNAKLTTGAPGKITFYRLNGTLWIPGDIYNNHVWNGMFPPANAVEGSGPVHVFYDGDEQILTSWSTQTTSLAEERGLSFEAPGWFPSVHWNGPHIYVTETFHTYRAQHQTCIHSYNDYSKTGNGWRYGSYVKTVSGFYGPFDIRVINHGSRTIETSKTYEIGDEFLASSFEGNGTFQFCPNDYYRDGSGNLITQGIVRYRSEQYDRHYEFERHAIGAYDLFSISTLVLLPTEREAVLGLSKSTATTSSESYEFSRVTKFVHVKEMRAEPVPDQDPFTDLDTPRFGDSLKAYTGSEPPPPNQYNLSSKVNTYRLEFRASGGISISQPSFGPDLENFLNWSLFLSSIWSNVFFMRGNLYDVYPDLEPPDQKKNYVLILDGVWTANGGFQEIEGKDVIAFVGRV